MAEYYNVTTNLGDAEIANAIAANTKLNITHIAFGDGNGSVPTPNKARTSLVREVHRQAVTKYERHPTNANWIVIETIIPSDVGGFTIREMGIIANGKLISHGSHAPFEKVADPSGVSEYRLRFTQNVTDGSVVELTLDESLIYATQAWIDENYIKRSEIVDNLITNDETKPVSAKQAKNLQDSKLDKTANAASSTRLNTPINIALSGAVSGNANFDGSGNVEIVTSPNTNSLRVVEGNGYTITYDDARRIAIVQMTLWKNKSVASQTLYETSTSNRHQIYSLPIMLKKRISADVQLSEEGATTPYVHEAGEWLKYVMPDGYRSHDATSKLFTKFVRWLGSDDEPVSAIATVVGIF